MKYLVLMLEVMMILPLASTLRKYPRYVPLLWRIVGVTFFLSSVIPQLGVSVIDWASHPGYTKGVEVTIIDIIMLAIFISHQSDTVVAKPPFRISMKLFFCAVTASAFFASIPMAALFYSWQLLRMYLVFIVVARASADDRVIPALFQGLAIGLIAEALFVVYQKYSLGALQPHGTFDHQNMLGLISNMVTIPIITLVLADRKLRLISWALIAGVVIAALTASRATMGLGALGFVLAYFQSTFQSMEARKVKLGVIGLLIASVVIPIGLGSFERRMEVQRPDVFDPTIKDERDAYIDAASMMSSDHPFGVGANNFIIVANMDGYYERAEIVWQSRSGHVHNIYWLTLAETGYAGLLTLSIVLLQPLYKAIKWSWRLRGHSDADLLGGLGVALLVTYLHSNYEWILVTATPQYFLALMMGLVAGIYIKLSSSTSTKRGSLNENSNLGQEAQY